MTFQLKSEPNTYASEPILDSESVFNILITTDNHLGYSEKDPVRGNDSFITFEEILKEGKNSNYDFILQCGDLFHENKPSRRTMYNCISAIRKYCFGSTALKFELLNDSACNLSQEFGCVNFEDSNVKVGLPILAIHGNHDDPSGVDNLCAMDELSAAGLLTMFKKHDRLDKIEVSPVILQKGSTKIGLYGLGAIRDQRLNRMFQEHRVIFRPPDVDKVFNILILHQNRVKHGETNYIAETMLPDFIDLVIWGHEHEARRPEWNVVKNFFVLQPGSSVATSLSPGESVSKAVWSLQVNGLEHKLTSIPLQTVRPFLTMDINLDGVMKYEALIKKTIAEMLQKSKQLLTGSEAQPRKPLLRLRVQCSHDEEDRVNVLRIARNYSDDVANAIDLILIQRKRITEAATKSEWDVNIEVPQNVERRVEDIVQEYFAREPDDSRKLIVLSEKGMGSAVKEFVDKEERDIISRLVEHQLKKTQDYLYTDNKELNDSEIISSINDYRSQRSAQTSTELESLKMSQTSFRKRSSNFSDSEDNEPTVVSKPSKTTRGRGRGKVKRESVLSENKRKMKQPKLEFVPDDDDDDIIVCDSDPESQLSNSRWSTQSSSSRTQRSTRSRKL